MGGEGLTAGREVDIVLADGRIEIEVAPLDVEVDTSGRFPRLTGGLSGGAVYDGLIAATARHHQRTLLTRDRRARRTYEALGIRYIAL